MEVYCITYYANSCKRKLAKLETDWVNFSAFLHLTGNDNLLNMMECIHELTPIPKAIATRLAHLVRIHMAIGEFPPAITTWIRTHDFAAVDRVIDAHIDQMILSSAKELDVEIQTCRVLWRALPSQMAREKTKFHKTNAHTTSGAGLNEALLLLLLRNNIIKRVSRVDCPKEPIGSFVYQSQYKFYFSDTGIFRRVASLPASAVNLETPALSRFRGILTESYALQTFSHYGIKSPYYWKSGNHAEVDFIIPFKHMIVPVEVKSARNVKSHSLALYRDLYAPPLALRVSLLNLKLDENLLNIPLYLMDHIPRIITHAPWP